MKNYDKCRNRSSRRTGSFCGNGSGEIVIAFTTANRVPHYSEKAILPMGMVHDDAINPLFRAVAECCLLYTSYRKWCLPFALLCWIFPCIPGTGTNRPLLRVAAVNRTPVWSSTDAGFIAMMRGGQPFTRYKKFPPFITFATLDKRWSISFFI